MTVLKHVNGNIGGINPIQYAFKEDFASLSVNPATLVATIAFKQGKDWQYLYATPETIQLEAKEEDHPSGMKYSYTLKMLVPRDRKEVELTLLNLNQRHLILNVIDMNGVSRYFGNLDCPMIKSAKLLKPAAIEGYNGWELQFTGEFSSPAPYSNAVITNPVTPPDPTG